MLAKAQEVVPGFTPLHTECRIQLFLIDETGSEIGDSPPQPKEYK